MRPLDRTLLASCVAFALALAGCGGSVTGLDGAAGSGGSATGGSGGSATGGSGGSATGGSGGSATGGSGGSTGGSGGSAGAGGAPAACAQTHDSIGFQVETYDGSALGCGVKGGTGTRSITGVVMDSKPDMFSLDSCPPNADCIAPMQTTIRLVEAPAGFAMSVPAGAFVKVDYEVQQPWGCEQRILVKNVPSWGGMPNPISPDPALWLAASDGSVEPLDGAGFKVQKKALGCPGSSPGCGGDPADSYLLVFNAGSGSKPVAMGHSITMMHHGAGFDEQWTARNLRSYISGACDDYWNWAWVISGTEFMPLGD